MSESGDRIALSDGRWLGFAEYGNAMGAPLFVFQGTPTSRLPHHPLRTSAPARLIVPERPGFGVSDFLPGRTFLDWPSDVLQLASHLGINRFSVVGISGGGPHALACGVTIPERIHRLGIVSSAGPFDAPAATAGMATQRKLGFMLGRYLRFLLRPLFWAFRNPARNPERFVDRFSGGFPLSDLAILEDPDLRALRARSYAEAARRGVRGFAWEAALFARPWGFSLGEVACEVYLWHGLDDTSTPTSMARYLADSLRHCRPVFYPGEGHFVALRHWDEIVATLVEGVDTAYAQAVRADAQKTARLNDIPLGGPLRMQDRDR